jgi:hypothetical protein
VPRSLPSRPSLEQLRRQARDLLRALRAADGDARRLLARHLPQADPQQAILAQALLVVAREHGFASWPQLRAHVEALASGRRALARQRRQRALLRREAEARRIAELAEPLVRAAAAQDLQALFTALAIGARDGERVRALLVERGLFSSVVDALLLGAAHPQPRVRFLAAQAMDSWADERCAAPLRAMLHDPVPRVRWAALHSLQCEECKLAPLPRADLTAELVGLALHDPSVKVRRVATYELGQACADERRRGALAQLAQDADATVRRTARRALAGHPHGQD